MKTAKGSPFSVSADLQLVILPEFPIRTTIMKSFVAFSAALLSTSALFAQEDPATKELRAEIQALKQRVTALEKIIAANQIANEVKQAQPAPSPGANEPSATGKILSGVKAGAGSVLSAAGNVIVPPRTVSVGKWTQLDNWRAISKGMTPRQIETLLGRPYKAQTSFNKRVDEYWLYRGRLPSGESVEGRVRFYKGKVTDWKIPGS